MVSAPSASGYVPTPNGAYRTRTVGSIQLRFVASNWQPERTGFHARVDIQANGATLAFDTFNVERDGERTRLANSAYAKLIGGRPSKDRPELVEYPSVYLQDDLDQFCDGLRGAYIEGNAPEQMHGSAQRVELEFICKPYILCEAGTVCFAPPGHGKSYLLWLMAACIDAGLDLYWPVRQSKVLVVNLERSKSSVAQRLGNINEVLGLERDRPLDVVNARGKTLQDVAMSVQRHVQRAGTEVVLLDSLSRAGPGSLSDDDVVNGYCNILNSLGVAWFALGHSPRADATHLFGSLMFDAAADLMVRLTMQEKLGGPMGMALDLVKRNDIGKQPLWVGAFEFGPAGLIDVRPARPGEFQELEAGEKMSMEDKVAAHITRLGIMSPTRLADELGYNRVNVSDMLNSNARFVFVRKEGRLSLYGLRAQSPSVAQNGNRATDPGEATGGLQDGPWWAEN